MRGQVPFSQRFRILIIGAFLIVTAVGVARIPGAPRDAFGEFAPPTVQIQTDAPGLSAAEVEQLVTVPLEQDLLNGVPWLAHMRSASEPGLSQIDLTFTRGTDILNARQAVQERLSQARALPNVGTPPVMIQPLSASSRVMMIGLTSNDLSLIDLSVLARWKIRPALMGIPGVANVAIWGQRDRQLQVQVDPEKLRAAGVTLDQVIDTTGNALWVSPLNFLEASTPGTGGFVDTADQRLAIQHVLPITSAADLARVTLDDGSGRSLRLGDISTVVEDHQPLIGDAVDAAGPGLSLVIEKFPGADTRKVTHDVEDALAEMQPGLRGVRVDTGVFRPETFIDAATRNVGLWLLILIAVVVAVIGGLLASWRAALIGFVGITVSLITALYVLYLFGVGYNLLVLAGLGVALLAMIDDVVAGARWRVPLGFATAILLLSTVPIFFIGGWATPLARSLVEAYVTAVAASMLVALTVTPALDGLLPAARARRTVPLSRLAAGWHRFVVRPLLVRRWRTAATVALLLLAALALLPQLASKTLIPTAQDRNLLVHLRTAPGTSVLEMSRITGIESAGVRGIAGVEAVGSHVGRAVMSDQAVDVNQSELWVRLADSADYASTVSAIKRHVAGYPGVSASVETYEQDRIDAVRADAAQSEDVVVHVFGPDFAGLKEQADRVRAAISGVSGIVDARTQAPAEQPTLTVAVDLAAAQQSGVKPGDVRRTASTYFAGLLVGSFYEDQRVFDVVVWGTPPSRATPANLANLQVPTPSGGSVRLGDVAAVKIAPAPAVIAHTQSSRVIDVTADVKGRDLPSVLRDVRARLATMQMPLEFHSEVSSDVAAAAGGDVRTLWLVAGALIGALLLMQAAFSSWRLAALALVVAPLSVVGGLLTAPLVGGVMSLGALLGLLAVFGLAARNAVVVLHRLRAGTDLPEVLEPVLLSAAAVGASMIPVLILGDVAGLEVLHPFAAVVLGGLVSSTMVTSVVLPALTGTGEPALERRIPRPRETPAPAPARSGVGVQGPLRRSVARPLRAVLALLVCAAALAGCTGGGSGASDTAPNPATTVSIPGTDVKKLVLTADAVQRVGITTQPVAASGAQTQVPMSAVYYDNAGVTWVYTNPEPLTYVRVKVTLASVNGDTAVLSDGPPVGTQVVTVGEPELYGVEYGTAGEQ